MAGISERRPTAIGRAMDGLYVGGAIIGAVSIVGIGLLIVSQVVGRQLGIQVKGADDLTAWSVVAAGFMPLAYTYRYNSHIRVTLVVERLRGLWRKGLEFVILGVSLFLVGFMTYSAFDMIWDSYRFDDLSQNLIVIPIWIPQLSLGLGSVLFLIAIIDDVVVSMVGGEPAHITAGQHAKSARTGTD